MIVNKIIWVFIICIYDKLSIEIYKFIVKIHSINLKTPNKNDLFNL